MQRLETSGAIVFQDDGAREKRLAQKQSQTRLDDLERDVNSIKEKIKLISRILENAKFH